MAKSLRGKDGGEGGGPNEDVIWMGNGELYDGKRGSNRDKDKSGRPPWQAASATQEEDSVQVKKLREKVDLLKKEGAAMKEVREEMIKTQNQAFR